MTFEVATRQTPVEIDGATQGWESLARYVVRARAFPRCVPCRSTCRALAGLRALGHFTILVVCFGTSSSKRFT